MGFALRTIAPVAGFLVMLVFVQSAECVFAMVTSADIENVRGGYVVRGVADETLATFSWNEGTLFSAETTIRTYLVNNDRDGEGAGTGIKRFFHSVDFA
jgi:hypothetical protein